MNNYILNSGDAKRSSYSNTYLEVSILAISILIIVFSCLVLFDSPVTRGRASKFRNNQSTETSIGIDLIKSVSESR